MKCPDEEGLEGAEAALNIFDILKIGVEDGIGRADTFLSLGRELLRLGFLGQVLRISPEFHRYVDAAARICKTEADRELERVDRLRRQMKDTLGATEEQLRHSAVESAPSDSRTSEK